MTNRYISYLARGNCRAWDDPISGGPKDRGFLLPPSYLKKCCILMRNDAPVPHLHASSVRRIFEWVANWNKSGHRREAGRFGARRILKKGAFWSVSEHLLQLPPSRYSP